MQINPNAHALDGGPATAALEREVVADLARMFGYTQHLGHLTSSGTIANLEALFVARSLHPDRGIAFSAEAHYTHGRMCGVLGIEPFTVPADAGGRMDLEALQAQLASGRIGTVVATAGTTGLGAVDQVQAIVELAQTYGARVHVDSAYGGFFRLLADADQPLVEPQPWLAIADADSVVVDPHKHGLQPYGCGAVLFRDPSVGRFYDHDSPYTYFTSDELHLGEISLECSRAGAAAAAFWATVRTFPLRADEGFGPILAACRRAAIAWDALVGASDVLAVYQPAEIDIVTYFDRTAPTTSAVDASSGRVLQAGMTDPDPVFVSTLNVSASRVCPTAPARHRGLRAGARPAERADEAGARAGRAVAGGATQRPHRVRDLDSLSTGSRSRPDLEVCRSWPSTGDVWSRWRPADAVCSRRARSTAAPRSPTRSARPWD